MKSATREYLLMWGSHILYALLIFLVGYFVAKYLVKFLRRTLNKTRLDAILVNFLSSFTHVLFLTLVAIAALHTLGVDTTSIIALLGAAGLAVGLALRDSLQNFASGILLILFRPFGVGDFVEVSGVAGLIEEVAIFNTVMKTLDNLRVIVPNGIVYRDKIINYSSNAIRRVDLAFTIGFEEDLKRVKEVIWTCLKEEERILNEPEPFVGVGDWLEHGIRLLARPWVRKEDFWEVKTGLLEKIKYAFDEAGITPPYPRTHVVLKENQRKVK